MIQTLTGENTNDREAALHQLVQNFTNQHGDMAVERLDGEEASFERMQEAVQGLPFLALRKLVLLRMPSANKTFVERFQQFLQNIAEGNDVVIIEPKLDKRTAYYKQLQKHTQFCNFAKLDASGLAQFASDYVREKGGVLAPTDARLLISYIGDRQEAVRHELDKLLAYDTSITKRSIDLLTERTPQSTIFDLIEKAFSGDVKSVMWLYDEQRSQHVEPQQIIAMLAWQLHVVAVVLSAGSRSSDDIARVAKLNPYVVRKTQVITKRLSPKRLRELIVLLRELDQRIKSQGVVPDEVMRYYLLVLTC